MKKKILLLAAALMMFMGIVSASSINGDYKGNPIVKVMSNGKQLQSDEVPAQIYDGHTVVPISLLRQLGASVEWNQDTYSVDVKLPIQQQPATNNVNLENVIIGFNQTAKEYNASNVQMVFNDLGGYISADLNLTGNDNTDVQNIMLTSSFVAKSPATQIFIHLYKNNLQTGFYDINRLQVESYINSELNVDNFIKTWSWHPSKIDLQPTITPVPAPTPTTSSRAIETTIDGEFTGWEGETIFKLSNGQIWQQSSFAYTYTYAFMPKVLIYKDGNGYKMQVDGVKETIYVKQIK